MIYTIYLHRNIINNKVYIGQTCQKPKDRWKNGSGYVTCKYFYSAIQKYGWDNFEHIILEQQECTQDIANEIEKYYIEKYDSTNPKKGYNITNGGNTVSPNMNKAIIDWMKKHPEFGLARAQDMLKWQKEHPIEALEMKRINAKKATAARRKKVRCIETGIVYESASAAARIVPKTTQSKICMVCKGKRKTCGGFHWKYEEELND